MKKKSSAISLDLIIIFLLLSRWILVASKWKERIHLENKLLKLSIFDP